MYIYTIDAKCRDVTIELVDTVTEICTTSCGFDGARDISEEIADLYLR